MLEKGKKYLNIKENVNYEVIDYIFYGGTKEHGFTFSINGKHVKKTVKESEIENYLLNFEENRIKYFTKEELNNHINKKQITIMEEKNNISEMREILFNTMRGVKDGTIDTQKALAISKVSESIINSIKVEVTCKINKVYPEPIRDIKNINIIT